MKTRLLTCGIVVGALLWGGMPREARADIVYTTPANQSDTDGPISASIGFAPGNGFLQITVTNLEVGQQMHLGQLISGFEFDISGLSTPTAFKSLAGRSLTIAADGDTWTSSSGTAFTDGPGPSIDHWGFTTPPTTSEITVETVGSPIQTGNPIYMILPTSGTAEDGLKNSNQQPFIIGPAVFDLTVAGMTTNTVLSASDFTNVKIEFGTGPEATLDGSPPSQGPPPPPAPEPSTALLLGFGIFGLARMNSRRSRSDRA
jgi:PEP-CTERM motif-containing protein